MAARHGWRTDAEGLSGRSSPPGPRRWFCHRVSMNRRPSRFPPAGDCARVSRQIKHCETVFSRNPPSSSVRQTRDFAADIGDPPAPLRPWPAPSSRIARGYTSLPTYAEPSRPFPAMRSRGGIWAASVRQNPRCPRRGFLLDRRPPPPPTPPPARFFLRRPPPPAGCKGVAGASGCRVRTPAFDGGSCSPQGARRRPTRRRPRSPSSKKTGTDGPE